jgi:hypothetical protein
MKNATNGYGAVAEAGTIYHFPLASQDDFQ